VVRAKTPGVAFRAPAGELLLLVLY
jgi:hypothetical protein